MSIIGEDCFLLGENTEEEDDNLELVITEKDINQVYFLFFFGFI